MGKKLDQSNFILWLVFVGIVGIVGVIIGALLGYLGAMSIQKAELVSSTETPVSSFTDTAITTESPPAESLSDAIIVVNNFYDWINTARNKNDLLRAWNLLTSDMQCNEIVRCDPTKFLDYWWHWELQYKLYNCGSNIVDTETRYSLRDPLLDSTPTAPYYVRFQLVKANGELKISKNSPVEGPGTDCDLAVSVP